ncbi:MAG: putative toxin-antitoxin system toxin component, PIN family, partial [Thermodesulfobacteriota bacterium]|nr:putative toxin-antitoxin system toxin component, PIN family [Thermodesulfobacteriota bacterium]
FVLDTNIIISALLFQKSKPAEAFHTAIKKGEILYSSSTLAELKDVLWRDKFDSYITQEERERFLAGFLLTATPIEINETITICRDPKDNKFLELAVSGKANFIITGDDDLLILNPFRKIQIITPAKFTVIVVRTLLKAPIFCAVLFSESTVANRGTLSPHTNPSTSSVRICQPSAIKIRSILMRSSVSPSQL